MEEETNQRERERERVKEIPKGKKIHLVSRRNRKRFSSNEFYSIPSHFLFRKACLYRFNFDSFNFPILRA